MIMMILSQLIIKKRNLRDKQSWETEDLLFINSFGVSSSYISASRKIIGATETPADVDDLSISMVGSNQMELSWTPVV